LERKLYEPTEKEKARGESFEPPIPPTDEQFKIMAKKSRKTWGIVKRDWMLSLLACNPDYGRGMGQGRVDAARGLEYSEERNQNAYNLGYYRGYTNYHSDRKGWHEKIRAEFDSKYLTEQEVNMSSHDGDITPGTNSYYGTDISGIEGPARIPERKWGAHGIRYDEGCRRCHRDTEIDNDTELCRKCSS
jgi:hypothetical protein